MKDPVETLMEAPEEIAVKTPVNAAANAPSKSPVKAHAKTIFESYSELPSESSRMSNDSSRENQNPSPPKALITQRVVLRYNSSFAPGFTNKELKD